LRLETRLRPRLEDLEEGQDCEEKTAGMGTMTLSRLKVPIAQW